LTDNQKWHGLRQKTKPQGSSIVAMAETQASLLVDEPIKPQCRRCGREWLYQGKTHTVPDALTVEQPSWLGAPELTGNDKNADLDHVREPSSRWICRRKDNNASEVLVIHV
jgi:hypothetical protein